MSTPDDVALELSSEIDSLHDRVERLTAENEYLKRVHDDAIKSLESVTNSLRAVGGGRA